MHHHHQLLLVEFKQIDHHKHLVDHQLVELEVAELLVLGLFLVSLVNVKMKIKKEIIQLFQVNQKLTIQFSRKFLKLHLIALNKNILVIMLMLKLAVKSSTFVLSTIPANMISSVQMEQFSHKSF